jgi:hypothetical protein
VIPDYARMCRHATCALPRSAEVAYGTSKRVCGEELHPRFRAFARLAHSTFKSSAMSGLWVVHAKSCVPRNRLHTILAYVPMSRCACANSPHSKSKMVAASSSSSKLAAGPPGEPNVRCSFFALTNYSQALSDRSMSHMACLPSPLFARPLWRRYSRTRASIIAVLSETIRTHLRALVTIRLRIMKCILKVFVCTCAF